MQRLSIGDNNNHMYVLSEITVISSFHYVEGHFDQFRVFGLKDSNEPFYSLTYAIAPILKVSARIIKFINSSASTLNLSFLQSITLLPSDSTHCLSIALVLVGLSHPRYALVLESRTLSPE